MHESINWINYPTWPPEKQNPALNIKFEPSIDSEKATKWLVKKGWIEYKTPSGRFFGTTNSLELVSLLNAVLQQMEQETRGEG